VRTRSTAVNWFHASRCTSNSLIRLTFSELTGLQNHRRLPLPY